MKKLLHLSFSFLAAVIMLTSCGKKYPEQLKIIPKNSASIVGFNIAELGDTLAKDNASIDSIFGQLKETSGTDVMHGADFNGIKNSGLDFTKTIYFFGNQTNSVSKGTVRIVNAAAALKDEKQLDSFLMKHGKIGELKKANGFSYRVVDNNSMVSWNKNTVVWTNYMMVEEKVFDSSINELRKESASKQTENMLVEVEKLFNLKESESAASLDGFVDLVKGSPQVFSWNNMDNMLNAYTAGMPLPVGLSEIFKDNFVATTFNFERGKIAAHSTCYFNAGMQALLKQYNGPKVNLDLISKFPSQNIDGAFIASFNPQIFPALLKLSSTESFANLGLTTVGLTTDDLTSWMKGDIAVVLSDFTLGIPENAKDFSIMDMAAIKPSAKLLISIPVTNKAALDKVLTSASKFIDEWKMKLKEHQLYLKITNDNVFVTSDTALIDQYLASKQPANIDKALLDRFNGKAIAGYVDFNRTMQGISFGKSIPLIDSIKTTMNNTFGNALFTMDNYDGKVIKADAELQLKDNSMNSASVLVKLFENTMKQFKNSMMGMEKQMNDKFKNLKPSDVEKMLKEE